MPRKHLAIFSPSVAERIISGAKTIETRFSQKKISPFLEVQVGDLVYIKPVGKEIIGQFVVSKVIFFEGLKISDLENLRKIYGKEMSVGSTDADNDYFNSKMDSKYGTIIFISQVESFITSPIKIPKKDQRGWVLLSD